MTISIAISLLGVLFTIVVAVIAHFRTVSNLKEKIYQVEKETERLKGKDDLQQQVIDQLGKQIELLIPKLLEAVKQKSHVKSQSRL